MGLLNFNKTPIDRILVISSPKIYFAALFTWGNDIVLNDGRFIGPIFYFQLELHTMNPIEIRWMSPEEIEKIRQIDRSETIRSGYRVADGQLQEIAVEWDVPPWHTGEDGPHSMEEQVQFCRDHLGRGAWMCGAFDGERLVGIGIHTPDLRPGMDQLAYLHVSHGYRHRGIGYKIAAEIERHALDRGATRLYVSATPSASAVGFYQKFGFKPVEKPLPELFDLEPEDIHMMKLLNIESTGPGPTWVPQ